MKRWMKNLLLTGAVMILLGLSAMTAAGIAGGVHLGRWIADQVDGRFWYSSGEGFWHVFSDMDGDEPGKQLEEFREEREELENWGDDSGTGLSGRDNSDMKLQETIDLGDPKCVKETEWKKNFINQKMIK